MGWDDIQGIVRHILTTLAGILVADGYLTSSDAQQAVGGLMVIAGVCWSLYSKCQHRRALAAATISAK